MILFKLLYSCCYVAQFDEKKIKKEGSLQLLCTDLCSMAMELLAQIVDLTVCIIVVSSNNGLIMKYFIINFDVGKVKERLLQRTLNCLNTGYF